MTMAPGNTTSPPRATIDIEGPMKHSGDEKNLVIIDVVLRAVLFATTLGAIIVMVTSKQTKMIPISRVITIPLDANWNQSPANIYFVAAHCVACLYSIMTSISSLKKIGKTSSNFVILDSLLLGIISSAVGAVVAVGYIAFKGNSHARWNEICSTYGSFCHHMGFSIFSSLISTGALMLLVWSPSMRKRTES